MTFDFWFWTHIDGFISEFMFWIISLYYIHLYRRKYHADFILCAKSNSAAYNIIFTSLCCVITLKIILILKLNSCLLYMSDKNIYRLKNVPPAIWNVPSFWIYHIILELILPCSQKKITKYSKIITLFILSSFDKLYLKNSYNIITLIFLLVCSVFIKLLSWTSMFKWACSWHDKLVII